MPTDRDLDRLIDAALPSYSAAEPQCDLEQQVLARVRTERPRKAGVFLGWALAIPAMACLLTFLLMLRFDDHSPQIVRPITQVVSPPPTSPAHQPDSARTVILKKLPQRDNRRASAETVARAEALPKKNEFPAATPLSAEEKALILFARIHSQAPQAVNDPPVDLSPIDIVEIHIEPIVIPSIDSASSSDVPTISQHHQP